jgi:hypothetical protein
MGPLVTRGLPEDGDPLSFDEERALSDVDMDSMIVVPEPVYGTEDRPS